MISFYSHCFLIGCCLCLLACFDGNQESEPREPLKVLTGDSVMVATSHPLAAQSGWKVLRAGGNAIDAIIAIQFTLAVVNPRAGNIGGGGFLLFRDEKGNCVSLDHREKAPEAAHRTMYLDSIGNPIPGASLEGPGAAGVPGTVAGLYEAWSVYSALKDWPFLLQDAIRLAESGFRISRDEADRLNYFRSDFIRINRKEFPFVKNEDWQAGDLLVQPMLANTLKEISNRGAEGFYRGPVAKAIVDAMATSGGYLSEKDLLDYTPIWREPLSKNYRNYRVWSMPPPSSGGVVLLQILKFIEPFPLSQWGPDDPKTIHLLIEAESRAYADRARHLGDIDFYPVPLDTLLNDTYLNNRFANFNLERATGKPSEKDKVAPVSKESFETTHTSVVDAAGQAAALTTTLNSNYGSKFFVEKAGFFLNNEMDDFSIKPGVPNQFGLVGSKANAIAPGKRMLSSMTPTIIEKDNQLFLVLGSPGGSTIITSVLQVFLNLAEFEMPLDEAVARRRIHHQWLPDEVWVEGERLDSLAQQELIRKGHKFVKKKVIGAVKAIHVQADGKRTGVGDPRKPDDAVAGY